MLTWIQKTTQYFLRREFSKLFSFNIETFLWTVFTSCIYVCLFDRMKATCRTDSEYWGCSRTLVGLIEIKPLRAALRESPSGESSDFTLSRCLRRQSPDFTEELDDSWKFLVVWRMWGMFGSTFVWSRRLPWGISVCSQWFEHIHLDCRLKSKHRVYVHWKGLGMD